MKTTARLLLASTVVAMPRAFASNPPADASKTKEARVEPVLTAVHSGIAMPVTTSNRGSKSIYNFDGLVNVGDAFGVKNKTAASLSSIVSNANKKAMQNKTDATGATIYKTKEITDPTTGAKVTVPSTEAERVSTKKFKAFDVTPAMAKDIKGTPLEGSKALVFRIPLD